MQASRHPVQCISGASLQCWWTNFDTKTEQTVGVTTLKCCYCYEPTKTAVNRSTATGTSTVVGLGLQLFS